MIAVVVTLLLGCTSSPPKASPAECEAIGAELTIRYLNVLKAAIEEVEITQPGTPKHDEARSDAVAMQRRMRTRVDQKPGCFTAAERRLVRQRIPT